MNNDFQKLTNQIMSFVKSNINTTELWTVIKGFRDKKNIQITWVTAYSIVKNNDITRQALTKSIKEGIVRQNEEGLIAKEDLDMYMTLRDFFKELEDKNVINMEKVKDRQQYVILDTFKHNKSTPEYQTEVLAKILEGFAKNYLGIDLGEMIHKRALEL